MIKFTSAVSMMLVIAAVFQHTPVWAERAQAEQSQEAKIEMMVNGADDKAEIASIEGEIGQCYPSPCDPCYPPSCSPMCPPPCEPCNPPPCSSEGYYPQQASCPPPCDPCAPRCKQNTGVSIWAIGLALLAVGGAAAIVVTSNNGGS